MTTAHNNDHLYYDSDNPGIVSNAPDTYHALMEAALQDPHVASILEEASEAKRKNSDAAIYPKFTCSGCGERCWANEPGQFHYMWNHEEKLDGKICGYKTPITSCDLGFAMILQRGEDTLMMATPEGSGAGSMVQVLGEGEQADKWRAAIDTIPAPIFDGNRRFGPSPTTES